MTIQTQTIGILFTLRSLAASAAFVCICWFRFVLRRVHDALAPAELVLTEQFTGFWRSAALAAAAELRISDHLSENVLSMDDLARRCGSEPVLLKRLLASLATIGVFRLEGGKVYQTRLSRGLRVEEVSECAALGKALLFQKRVQWSNWNRLSEVVQTGLTASGVKCGLDPRVTGTRSYHLFDEMEKSPEDQKIFNGAMEAITALAGQEILAAFPWGNFETIVDIGGGSGSLMQLVHSAHGNSCKTVIDRRAAFAQSESDRTRADPVKGVQFLEGDFFDLQQPQTRAVLSEARLVVLKHILHDWNDVDAQRILQQVANCLLKGSRVLVIETIKSNTKGDLLSPFADLEMMHSFQSSERSLADFQMLFSNSGLEFDQVLSTFSPYRLLLCKKA